MIQPTINRATHFSIVWAVVLAVLAIVEWSSLDRDPMSEQIFLPFIEREITLQLTDPDTTERLAMGADDLPGGKVRRDLETHVEIAFNGPLFLTYFFGPVLIFHTIGLLWSQLRRGS
jgi:hypothetical protein